MRVYGLALLATAALQLARITAIDYTGPIAAVQHSVLRLKQLRTKSERILLAIGGVGWVPVMFLMLYNAGLDVWSIQPSHVLANLGVGIRHFARPGVVVGALPPVDGTDRAGKAYG